MTTTATVAVSGGRTRRRASGPLALIVSRLGFLVTALFGVVTLSFLLISITPGDPARLIAGPMAGTEQVEAVRAELGLDRSLWTRYTEYVAGLFQGDLGTSYYSKQPVTSEIAARLPATLELVILSVIFACIVGVAAGTLGAYFARRLPDKLMKLTTSVFQSVPDFFLGLILIYVVFFLMGLAPSPSGRLDIVETPPPDVTGFLLIDSVLAGQWSTFGSAASHLFLPVITLGLVYAAYFAKTARSTVGKALNSQQVQFARAMGLPERTVVRYAFVEARTTLVTYSAVLFAALFGGETIVERIFAWGGLGTWALDGILKLDLPVVQGMVLVAGLITLVTYTVLDIAVGLLDPRISRG